MRKYSVEYDPESDAAYVRLIGDRAVNDTIEIESVFLRISIPPHLW